MKYALLRLRLFHCAGGAGQEKEKAEGKRVDIHIHRGGVYE